MGTPDSSILSFVRMQLEHFVEPNGLPPIQDMIPEKVASNKRSLPAAASQLANVINVS